MGQSRAVSGKVEADWFARKWAESLSVVLRELGSGLGAEPLTVVAIQAEAPGSLCWWEQPISSGEPARIWTGLAEEFAAGVDLAVRPEELLARVFESWAAVVAERLAVAPAAANGPQPCSGPGAGEHFLVQVPCRAGEAELRLVLPLGMREDEAAGEVLDVAVSVTASLGRLRMPLDEALRLGPGSVIQLNRSADAPVELEVQDVPVARGRLVVIGDAYGIKVEELLRSPVR